MPQAQALPRIRCIATAVPPHRLSQQEAKQFGRRVFADKGEEMERLLPVYDNAGIETRYSCAPLAWLGQPQGWPERNRIYMASALDLLHEAAEQCLRKARMTPRDVDGILVASTTGIATPSLDAALMERMAFRRTVQRLPVFGYGCAGGVLGLARAAALARAVPGETWLLLVVELCCLTFRSNDRSKSNVIATALFGDGAAAALIQCGETGPAITGWGEYTWPDSLDVMGWRIEDDGFGVLFSRDIPCLVGRNLLPAADAFLARNGLGRNDIDSWLFHPGGAKVLDALEDALDLPRGDLVIPRAILRDYGNMSAATLLFILERALAGDVSGRTFAGALGPGFTAGFLLLEIDR
jgi:alkylresorcinol/alkylpyrone synthase